MLDPKENVQVCFRLRSAQATGIQFCFLKRMNYLRSIAERDLLISSRSMDQSGATASLCRGIRVEHEWLRFGKGVRPAGVLLAKCAWIVTILLGLKLSLRVK